MRKNLTVCVPQQKGKGKKEGEKNVRLILTMAYSRKETRKEIKAGKKFYVFHQEKHLQEISGI